MESWKDVQDNLTKTINIIFNGYDISNLSYYEKRKMIFEYLTNTLNYDYDLLNQIKNFEINKSKIIRDPIKELNSVINKKIGICNAISQYYKLLLEEVGIISYCVICDDGTQVKHQLNLVYDDYHRTYSFDDVTSVIVKRGTNEEYFDYDLETANFFNQGNVEVFKNKKWFILPEDFINYLIGRENKSSITFDDLPNNISSIKLKSTTNIKS